MKRLAIAFLLLLPGCPIRVDPPDPASYCPGRPNCGQCAEGSCVWCDAPVADQTGCYAQGRAPEGCRAVTVLELCPGSMP